MRSSTEPSRSCRTPQRLARQHHPWLCLTPIPAEGHKGAVNPAKKWGASVGKHGICPALLRATRPSLRAGWVHASLCYGNPNLYFLCSSIICREHLQTDTWSITHMSNGWLCAESSHLLPFSSSGGKEIRFLLGIPKRNTHTSESMARADPGNPLLPWESRGEAWTTEVLCRAGGQPRGDLTPRGRFSLPCLPQDSAFMALAWKWETPR